MIPIFNNPMVGGTAFLGLTGAIIASLRNLPKTVFDWGKRQVVTTVEIRNSTEAYRWIIEWLDQHPYSRKSRALTVSAKRDDKSVTFTPSVGTHLFRYKNIPVWLKRELSKSEKGEFETIHLTALTRSQNFFRDLLAEAYEIANSNENKKTRIYINSSWDWYEVGRNDPRTIDTVVSPNAQELLDDVKHFLGRKEWYRSVGIPYRRGYLLYGEPGNGKSSLAAAIAGETGMNLCVLSIASKNTDDERLAYLMARVPENSIVLLEDVDAAFNGREKSEENASQVTMSGLLNALDGVCVREGQIVIMTTNHKEKLDPALIRPGRADKQIYMGDATYQQAEEMYLRFFNNPVNAKEFASSHVGVSMASIQNDLLSLSAA